MKKSIKGLYLVNAHYPMTIERQLFNTKTKKMEEWTETIQTPEEMEVATKKFMEKAKKTAESESH